MSPALLGTEETRAISPNFASISYQAERGSRKDCQQSTCVVIPVMLIFHAVEWKDVAEGKEIWSTIDVVWYYHWIFLGSG